MQIFHIVIINFKVKAKKILLISISNNSIANIILLSKRAYCMNITLFQSILISLFRFI